MVTKSDVLPRGLSRRAAMRGLLLFAGAGLAGCPRAPLAAAGPPAGPPEAMKEALGPSGKPMLHPPHDHGPRPAGAGAPPLAIVDGDRPPAPGSRLTCPVCGDEFTLEDKLPTRHYKGKVLIFCCERCLPHFDKNPELFVSP